MNLNVDPAQLMYIAEKTAKRWAKTYDEVDEIQGEILLQLCEYADRINNDAKPVRMCWVVAKSKARDMWLVKLNRQRITGVVLDVNYEGDNKITTISDNEQCIIEADFRLTLVEILRTAPPVARIAIKKKIEGVSLDSTERVSLMRWRKQHSEDLKELVA